MASIDQRIVELKFKANNFKSGIQAAIASLDNLKKNLNLNKAASEFDKVEKASKKVKFDDLYNSVENISNRFSTLGIIGMSALNQITTTAMQTGKKLLSALTAPLIEGGKRRALNIEQAKFQIQGLGYTWESVEEDINYGVKDTAYGLDAAAKAASQLLASQVKVGAEMKASLRGISGVAAMTSSEYEDIANIFTTVAGNGRLMGDQLMQLSSRGLNAAATLGQYLGKTEGEVRDMVSKGKIDFATFAAAMDSAFGEHAKKANETFTGSLSNMKAALARIGAEVASPAYVHLRDIFNSLTPVFDGIKAALVADGGLIDAIKSGMSYVAKFVTQTLDGLGGKEGVATALASVMQKLTRILKAFGSLMLGVAKTINGVVSPIFSAFAEVLGGTLLDSIGGAIEIFAKFINSIAFTQRMSNNLKKTFVGIFTIFDTLFKLITAIVAVVSDVLFSAFSGTFGFVLDVILAITGHIGDLIVRIHKFITDLFALKTVQDLLNGVATIFNKIRSIVDTVYSAFRNLVGIIIDATFESALWIFDKIAEAILLIAKFLDNTITKLREFIRWLKSLPAVQRFVEKIKTTFENIQSNIGGVASSIKNNLIVAFNAAKNVVNNFIGKLRELVSQYIEIPTLQEVVTAVVEFMTTTFEKAVEIFNKIKEVLSDLFDRAKELSQISLKGIIENFGKLRDKMVEVIDISGRLAFLKNLFGDIRDGAVAAAQGTGSTLELIKEKLLQFVEWVKGKFSQLTMGDVMAAGVGGTFIVFLIQLTKWMKTVEGLSASLKGAVDTFKGIGSAIKSTIKSFEEINKAKANAIKMDAISNLIKSVVLLAGAVALLASMDPNRVVIAAGVLLILAGGLIGLSAAMNAIATKSDPKAIAESATQMIAASGSILILAAAMKLLSTIPVGQIVSSLVAVTFLLGEMLAFMVVMGKFAPEAAIESTSMLIMAGALLVLARAMNMIGSMSVGDIIKSVAVISSLMIALGVMFRVAKYVTMSKYAAVGILAITASIMLIVRSLKTLAKMDSNTVSLGISRMMSIMAAFSMLMIATRFAGKNAAKAGGAIILISVAMNIMAIAIKQMASIDDKSLSQATKAINEMLKVFALITLMTMFSGENALKAGGSIMMMAGAIVIISGAMVLLSRLSDEDLKKATAVVTGILGMFALIVAATGMSKACQKTLKQMTICLGLLLAALAVLSLIEPKNLLGASVAISLILATFSLLTSSTGKVGDKAMKTVWGLVAVMGAISILLAALSQLPMDNVLPAATALSEIMAVIAGVVIAFDKFNVVEIPVTAIAELALAIDAVIAIVAALVTALGAINTYIPEFEQFLSAGIPIMQKIGQAIGEFVGGIIGGIAAGASAALVDLANNLNAFIETLQPFLEQVSKVDDAAMDGAFKLVEMLLMFAGADLINSLSFFGDGKDAIDSLAEGLPKLGTAMADFASILNDGVNLEALAIGAEAGKMIAELGTVFSEGGAKGLLFGSSSEGLGNLGQNLVPFGIGLKMYSQTVNGLNAEAILNSVEPARALVDISNSINGEGLSLLSVFGGSNAQGLSALSENLPTLATALVNYSNNLNGLDAGAINSSIQPLRDLVDISNTIKGEAAEGNISLLSVFGGSNAQGLYQLSQNLPILAEALTSYSNNLNGLDAAAVNGSIQPLRDLVDISNNIEKEGFSLLSVFGGSNSTGLQELASNLPTLGEAIKNYGDQLVGMKSSLINKSVEPLRSLVEISNMIDKEGGTTWLFGGSSSDAINNFKENLPGLGEALKNYSDNVNGTDAGVVSNSVECLRMIIEVLNASKEGISSFFGGSTSGGITSLKDNLPGLGEAIKQYNDHVTDISPDKIDASLEGLKKLIEIVGNGAEYSEGMRLLSADIKLFSESYRDAVNNLDGVNYAAIDTAIEALNAIQEAVSNWSVDFSMVSASLQSFTDTLRNAAESGVKGFVSIFQTGGPAAAAAAFIMINLVVGAINTRMDTATAEIKSKGQEFMKSLAIGMTNSISAVNSAVDQIRNQILRRIKQLANEMKNQGKALMISLANGIKSGASSVNAALTSATSGFANAIKSKYNSMVDSGRYLMEGLKAGISGNSSGPINAAYDVGTKVVRALNNATGVNSPSKKTMATGRFFDMGLIVGIVKYSGRVLRTIKDLGNEMVEELNPVADGFALLDGLEPIITPTIDTSYVDKGIEKLNSSFSDMGTIPIAMQGRMASYSFSNMANQKMLDAEIQNGTPNQVVNNYDLTQNNYSPKALSRIDIYRDTKNQFSRLKEVVNA